MGSTDECPICRGDCGEGRCESLATVADRIKCGHLFSDGSLCLMPAHPQHEHHDDPKDPAPGLYAKVSGGQPLPSFAELRARYGDPSDLPPVAHFTVDADGKTTQHAPVPERVDFRDMLTTDAAWSVKSRLEVALGRPYLATKIAEQLDPETAARLCDRLDDLLRSAFDVARTQIAAEVSSAVDARIHAWQAEQDRRAKAVTRERFPT